MAEVVRLRFRRSGRSVRRPFGRLSGGATRSRHLLRGVVDAVLVRGGEAARSGGGLSVKRCQSSLRHAPPEGFSASYLEQVSAWYFGDAL